MSKTQLTKDIEKALLTYRPSKLGSLILNYMRNQYMEFEVPVTHGTTTDGLIDCVWVAEGFINKRELRHCRYPAHLTHGYATGFDRMCEIDFTGMSKDRYIPCEETTCYYNSPLISQDAVTPIICFEIKVTKSDFHSQHGHNFVGNLNYYVMPLDLYKEVKDEIPEHIGVVTYNNGSLRHKKECMYVIDVDESLYPRVLHTVLNKKDKYIDKLKRKYLKACEDQYNDGALVVRELLQTIQLMLPVPSCYNKLINSCRDCKSDNDKCHSCYYGYIMQSKYLEKFNHRQSLYNDILDC